MLLVFAARTVLFARWWFACRRNSCTGGDTGCFAIVWLELPLIVQHQRVDTVAECTAIPLVAGPIVKDVGQIVDRSDRTLVIELFVVEVVHQPFELVARRADSSINIVFVARTSEPLGAEATIGVL